MLTKAQLEMRRSGIGGSDVATVLGLNPWRTALQLWAEKIGKVEPQEQNAAMEWGSRLESAIKLKFEQEHDDYECSYGGATIRHADREHLLATPDAFLYDKASGDAGILEIKTSSQPVWDTVPLYYMLQAQHYCYVMDKKFYLFAVLFRGTEYREYGPFPFDRDAYEDQVIPELDTFWNAVENEDPSFPATDINDLNLIVDVDKGVEQKADLDMIALCGKHHTLKAEFDAVEAELKQVKLKIAENMGSASRLVDDAGKTLAVQIQTGSTKVVDAKRLKKEDPDLFEQYSKERSGYRSVRIYA